MRKETKTKISVLMTLILLLILALPAIADTGEIRLIMDGVLVQTDVAPYLHNNRTLVPVRVIAERLGADVHWEQSTETVTIRRDEDVLILTIGSPEVYVNGRKYILDTEPLIRDKRTMVPIRFISERLGASVFWDEKTNTVYIDSAVSRLTEASYMDGEGEGLVALKTNEDAVFVREYDPENHSILITLPGINCGIPLRTVPIQLGGVSSITAGEAQDGSAQVLIQLEPGQVWADTQTARSYILSLPRMVKSIAWIHDNELDTVMISTNGEPITRAMTLQDPWRAVVDLEQAILSDGEGTLELDHALVERIRFAQYDTQTVRVVADLVKEIPYQVVSDERGVRMIFSSLIQEVTVHEEEGSITVTLQAENGLKVSAPAGSKDVVWNIPAAAWSDAAVIQYFLGGDEAGSWSPDQIGNSTSVAGVMLRTIQVVTDAKGGLNLKLGLNRSAQTMTVLKNGITGAILSIALEPPPPLTGKTVVLDPGHGGSDPGAVGPQGTHEKNVNLAVGLRMKDELTDLGARVIMTREGDQFISLADRVKIANSSGADLYVSIHANGYTQETAHGTETFYCTTGHPDSAFLAQTIHQYLVSGIQRKDRGVKTASFTVLKETMMPSALVEIAFITNPEEELLLNSDGFRTIAAHSLCQGILAYFQSHS